MLYIHGIGHFHPDNIIDNQFLESLNIETNNEWIIERVGIQERRTVLPLDYIFETHNANPLLAYQRAQFTNADTGAKAARIALDQAKITPHQIGMVIAGSCSSQHFHPADACIIAAELEIQAPAIDINSACSTFAAHLHIVQQMETESSPDYILLVIPDNTTRSINYSDRRSAVLWGDATVALIVSKKHPAKMCITHTSLESNPSEWRNIILPIGSTFTQKGNVVQRFAIKTTIKMIEQLRSIYHIDEKSHYFIGHQANLNMLQTVCRIANISEGQHLYNVNMFGNCGGASAPSVLSQNWGRFKEGDKIMIVVVGAGLTWGSIIIEGV